MGNYMGFMSKGLPSTQMLNFLLGTLHKQFMEKEINNFDEFHVAILDILNAFNSSLPGKHYDAPPRRTVEDCYEKWKAADAKDKKELFTEFMKKNMTLSKLDNTTIITGVVTPPAAMVAKRAGENLPHLGIIKAVPDVVFVPSVTMVALVSAKLSRRIFMQNLAS